jgi:hypothetical protein
MNHFRREQRRVHRRSDPVTIRWATPEDSRRIAILAQLDESPVPAAPLLLAFVGDELWAAVSLGTGGAVTDPFRPSAEVAALVAARGRQLTVAARRSRRPRGLKRFGVSAHPLGQHPG